MPNGRQDRLDPVSRVSFEGTRLSRRYLADAYEQLVPVPSRRVAARAEGVMHDEPAREGGYQDRCRGQAC